MRSALCDFPSSIKKRPRPTFLLIYQRPQGLHEKSMKMRRAPCTVRLVPIFYLDLCLLLFPMAHKHRGELKLLNDVPYITLFPIERLTCFWQD
jgi:hypothetical protein